MISTCQHCDSAFIPRRRDGSRGRGKYCSTVCQRKAALAAAHRAPRPDHSGARNPNWRGGRSSRPYESYVKRFKLANPEKARAHRLVFEAVRAGVLVRPETCSKCAAVCRAQAHHLDYRQPLKVEWLCKRCHVVADKARQEAA